MRRIPLLLLNFVIVLLTFSLTVLAQGQLQSVIAHASDSNKKDTSNEKNLQLNAIKSETADSIKIEASWIQLVKLPETNALKNGLADKLHKVSLLTGNPTADSCGIKTDKLKVGDSQVKGTAEKGTKITVKVLNSPVTEPFTVGDDKAFTVKLEKPITKTDTVFLSVTCTTAPATTPATTEVRVPVVAVELKPNVVNQVNFGAKEITGTTTPGATVDFFRKKSANAEVTNVAEASGKFTLRLDAPITAEDAPYLQFTIEGQTISVAVDAVGFMDLTHANIIGIAPFGVVASQQASEFSKADPFGGFIVGYMAASRQQRLCRVEKKKDNKNSVLEEKCYYRVYDSKTFRPISKTKSTSSFTPEEAYREYELFKKTGEAVENDGKEYVWEDRGLDFRPNLNIRFQGIFQTDGRKASVPTEDTTPTNSIATQAAEPMEDIAFVAARKTFDTSIQIWQEYAFCNSPVLHYGPYFALGGSFALNRSEFLGEKITVDTDQGTVETDKAVTDNDGKLYYEAGVIINLYSPPRSNSNLYVQAIAAYGYYQAYADLRPESNTKRRGIAKLRVFPFGLNRDFFARGVATPMFGIDLNAGKGPDHAKFFVGMAFNVTKFISKYKGEE